MGRLGAGTGKVAVARGSGSSSAFRVEVQSACNILRAADIVSRMEGHVVGVADVASGVSDVIVAATISWGLGQADIGSNKDNSACTYRDRVK